MEICHLEWFLLALITLLSPRSLLLVHSGPVGFCWGFVGGEVGTAGKAENAPAIAGTAHIVCNERKGTYGVLAQ